jgi:thymidylate synthase
MKYSYNISQFTWDATSRVFSAREADLWLDNYSHPFPNGGKQFNIYNPRTNNHRRFRLVKAQDHSWEYVSDDGIACIVKKTITNPVDAQYLDLLQDIIIRNGVSKSDRTGTGTLSVFGRQFRHKMSDGFPLLTTKKMYWKGIVVELLWFLRGDTNIKYLVDNGCHIWDGDAYKNYLKEHSKNPNETAGLNDGTPFDKNEFIALIQSSNAFAHKWGELGPIYGKQWRGWTKFEDESKEHNEWYISSEPIDQIQNLIRDLKTNPNSRRLMVTAWNPAEIDKMTLPPCHYGFQVWTRKLSLDERNDLLNKKTNRSHKRENCFSGEEFERETLQDCKAFNIPTRAISLMWNQRSVDTFLGLPFNIASYGLLLSIIAEAVNMVPDELIGNLGDVHLYNNHMGAVTEQLRREHHPLPSLRINTEYWPTESGECGIGPLSSDIGVIINNMQIGDFLVEGYESEPPIKAPLNN